MDFEAEKEKSETESKQIYTRNRTDLKILEIRSSLNSIERTVKYRRRGSEYEPCIELLITFITFCKEALVT